MFFRKEYTFLSNFAFVPKGIIYNNLTFKSVENAYQAAKCKSENEMKQFLDILPTDAKKLGKTVNIREDWDDVKVSVMRDLLKQKFAYPYFRQKLKDTNDRYICEDNSWHDNFWGICHCNKCASLPDDVKQNNLGKILMEIRESIRP